MTDTKFPSFRERLAIWQKLLVKKGGITYSDVECAIAGKDGLSAEKMDTLRKDKERINRILAAEGKRLTDSLLDGVHHFSLPIKEDLVHLYYKQKSNKPTKDILDLITRMHGFLPEGFLSELSDTYRDIIENDRGNEQVIAFEKDCELLADMKFFSSVYKAINKNALLITKHNINNVRNMETFVFYPEFLKQYNSQWYVFGVKRGENTKEEKVMRILLSLIDSVEVLDTSDFPFIHSGVDYFDYFDEIVGVEYDANCKCEIIKFVVSKKIYNYIISNPLHSSQTRDSSLDKNSKKGFTIEVKRNKELIRTLLNYGKDVEIISPLKLRTQIKRELLKTLKNYE